MLSQESILGNIFHLLEDACQVRALIPHLSVSPQHQSRPHPLRRTRFRQMAVIYASHVDVIHTTDACPHSDIRIKSQPACLFVFAYLFFAFLQTRPAFLRWGNEFASKMGGRFCCGPVKSLHRVCEEACALGCWFRCDNVLLMS